MAAPPPVLAVTTPSIEGRRVTKYLGVVAGESVLGTGFDQHFLASLQDLVGGRVSGWEGQLQQARYTALQEMCSRAASVGANAVIGVQLDYEFVGQEGSIIFVSATGTAVVAEPARA